jgi:hypothetical protein
MGATLSTERIADLFTMAFAWRSEDPEGRTDLSGLRASNRAEFDAWLDAHDAGLVAERDKALAERDASRAVNAEFLAARSTVVADHEVCTTELAAAVAAIAAVRAARADHPVCKEHPDDDLISCGWKRTVLDVDRALAAEYRAVEK